MGLDLRNSAVGIIQGVKTALYCYFGVLRDIGKTESASRRLTKVLSAMREKEILLVLCPVIRTVRRYWEPMNKHTYIEPNEVMACFVENGLFQSYKDAFNRVKSH